MAVVVVEVVVVAVVVVVVVEVCRGSSGSNEIMVVKG